MIEVIEAKKDGTQESFGFFEDMKWANYHVGLAKATSGMDGYVNHEGSTWEFKEVLDDTL